jgi:hypothetical protein
MPVKSLIILTLGLTLVGKARSPLKSEAHERPPLELALNLSVNIRPGLKRPFVDNHSSLFDPFAIYKEKGRVTLALLGPVS